MPTNPTGTPSGLTIGRITHRWRGDGERDPVSLARADRVASLAVREAERLLAPLFAAHPDVQVEIDQVTLPLDLDDRPDEAIAADIAPRIARAVADRFPPAASAAPSAAPMATAAPPPPPGGPKAARLAEIVSRIDEAEYGKAKRFFGEAPIQLSMEWEGGGTGKDKLIFQWYGPPGGRLTGTPPASLELVGRYPANFLSEKARREKPLPVAEWAAWSPEEKGAFVERTYGWQDLSLAGKRQLGAAMLSGYRKESKFEKLEGAPKMFGKHLHTEGDQLYEIVTEGYVETIGDLFGGMNLLTDAFGEKGGGFHVHISFRVPRGKDVSRLWEILNTAIFTEVFEGGPNYLMHRNIQFPPAGSARELSAYCLGSQPRFPAIKELAVGLRDIYREEGRVGFEIRGLGGDPGRLQRAVVAVVSGLESLDAVDWQATGKPLDASMDRVEAAVADEVAHGIAVEDGGATRKLTPADLAPISGLFIEARKRHAAHHEMEVFDHRAAIPCANWEDQLYLPAEVRRQAVEARSKFARTIAMLAFKARRMEGAGQSIDPNDLFDEIYTAISDWGRGAGGISSAAYGFLGVS